MMIKKITALILITLLFCSCNDLPEQRITSNNPEPTEINSDEPETEIYQTYTFSQDDEHFLETCVLIGDSILGELTDSGILKAGQVLASHGITVTDIVGTPFPLPSGDETYLLTALVNQNPENIIILLGMNDIATSGIEEFTADYLKLISFIKVYCPDTVITVLSITPVNQETPTLTNQLIDEYNDALQAAIRELRDPGVRFSDLGTELKNSHGRLKSRFAQDDGVHLTTQGLYAVLWAICNNL